MFLLLTRYHYWLDNIISFLMLLSPKIEEVSQTCFVFDVVKFEH